MRQPFGWPRVAREVTDRGEVGIRRCLTCGLHITWPRLPDPQGAYSAFTFETWEAKYGAIDRYERPHDREQNYLEEVAIIRQYVPNGRLLDVGCNAGWLLGYLQRSDASYELEGLEPSEGLAEVARRRLGLRIHNTYLQELTSPQRYDALIATDVIEHIEPENVSGFLQTARASLKPSGHLFLKTPNVRFTALKSRIVMSLPRSARRFLIRAEDLWDAKEHLSLWDANTLPRILERNGLTPVRVFVPLPVQTSNSPVAAYILRSTLYRLARLFSWNKSIPAFAQDIFVVAQRVS